MNRNRVRSVGEIALIVVGAFISAAGLDLFIIPNRLVDGGLSGLAILLYDVFHLPVGPVLLLLNIPLFVLASIVLGSRFALRSVLGIVLLSLALAVIPVHPVVSNPLLAAVYGGLLSGAGVGIIFRMGGSTGGTDLVARLLRHYIGFPIGVSLLGTDFFIVGLFGLVMGATAAMYSLLALFVGTRVVDFLMDGLDVQRACLIISGRSEAIGKAIIAELGRGVTELQGRGLYSGDDRPVLLAVVSRLETVRLKGIVARTDPEAFLVIHHVHEVLGEGFRALERPRHRLSGEGGATPGQPDIE